jgi:arylsulfatase A-like enzyme
VAFVETHANKPFFLEIAYNAVHWPFQAPDRPDDVRDAESWLRGTRRDYGKMLERVDDGVGAILDALMRRGLNETTLVIVTSDNGGEQLSRGTPLAGGKGILFEGGIRVPCVIRWPGRLPVGKVSGLPAITMDLTATIVAAAGAKPPKSRKLDGIDLAHILSGTKAAPERTFFWRIDRGVLGQWAARKGKWKYIRDSQGELLFDLEADIGERHDLSEVHPRTVAKLRKEVASWEAEMDRSRPRFSVK